MPSNGHAPVRHSKSDSAPAAPPVRVIDPNAVLRLDELRVVLGLPRTTLKREARAGRLRVVRRAGCYWVLGRWLLDYFEAGPPARGKAAGRDGDEP